VGHSTGGLDIRRLLWDLSASPDRNLPVDGTVEIRAGDILDLIERVVFLSVPQLGTNIAHWVRENMLGRAAVVAQLRVSVAASQVPVLNRVQSLIGGSAAEIVNLDLLRAVQDALRDADAGANSDPTRKATAHEAASHLELWLRHMASDFSAIDDLTPAGPTNRITERTSPAHFPAVTRALEVRRWGGKIRTRSYATVAPHPFRFEPGKPAPFWDLLKPWTWPAFTEGTGASAGTDLSYRYCYRACAGGPFQYPEPGPAPRLTPVGKAEPRPIENWDNDGIVNTASMLWPDGQKTVLVECDHMDIVGHYDRVRPGVYDLLESASGFEKSDFEKLWNDVFDFCNLSVSAAAA
jgi:hypothetical protein